MNLSTLKQLQKRIREATGPDRELDAAIFRALELRLPQEFLNLGIALEWQADGSATMPVGGMQVRYEPPNFTTDPDGLGACVALMREVLPGAIREVEATGKLPKVTVWRYHDIVWQARSTEEHAIESHATLLAIISAKISKLEAEQERIER